MQLVELVAVLLDVKPWLRGAIRETVRAVLVVVAVWHTDVFVAAIMRQLAPLFEAGTS